MSSYDENETIQAEGWVCPMPLRDYPNIILGHGGAGKLSAEDMTALMVSYLRERKQGVRSV